MSDVDLFDGLSDETATPTAEVSADAPTSTVVAETETPATDPATAETDTEPTPNTKPIETVAEAPADAVSVTEFAAYITQVLMKAKFAAGEDMDGTEFTVPQAVYQTVKASKDPIPHVLVKAEGDAEARVYILKTDAEPWWMARRERISTRGAGATRASNRTAEENLTLLAGAVTKSLYALARQAMWNDRVEQTAKLVDKYKGFLKEQEVAEETVTLALQEATDVFNAEQKAKADEKALKAKKSGKVEPEDNE